MLYHPDINPIIWGNSLGLRWYSLMYVLGLFILYVVLHRSSKKAKLRINIADIEWLIIVGLLGMMLGARLFYILFYDLNYYSLHPDKILAFSEGGLSFHGAMVGVSLSTIIYCHFKKLPFLNFADHVALAIPFGLGLGRIGNFINGELWGRTSDLPWAMVFKNAGPLARHPSQLYESFLEGPVLFILMYMLYKKNKKDGYLCSLFLVFYSIIRFGVEFFREPDEQLGFIVFSLSMGQLLSFLMLSIGLISFAQVSRRGTQKSVT